MEFLGAVGFLVPGAAYIRISMGILHHVAGKASEWQWGPTEQRAFEEVKCLVSQFSSHLKATDTKCYE